MKLYLLVLVSFFFLLISCKKDSNRNQAIKYLRRVEKHALQSPGLCFVTYFSYDLQNRVTKTSWYRVDSTGPALDSALIQTYTYQYSGASVTPDYVEWLNNSLANPPNYGLFGTQKTYNGNQLIKDSTYLISGIPPQSLPVVTKNYSYNSNQVSRLVYTGATQASKDTFIINGGNVTRSAFWSQLSTYAIEMTYSFDNKINPVNIPWIDQVHRDAILHNANNIVSALHVLNSGRDSVRWVSQFQYDSDNYPILELQDERTYYLPQSVLNYVIYYRYY